jgi:hypothetical protein
MDRSCSAHRDGDGVGTRPLDHRHEEIVMPNPQDPGLRRSEKDSATQDAWVNDVTGAPADEGATGPVPEDNRPGHHPDREQDKPTRLGGAGHGGSSADG